MPNWSISVLGDSSLHFSGSGRCELPASGWSLIGLLLCRPGHRANRAQLAAALWPDKDENGARHCLATTLWRFKQASRHRAAPVVTEGDTLRLPPNAWIDSEAFALRVMRARDQRNSVTRPGRAKLLRAGLRLYRGHFLGESFAEWALLERERLACLRLDALYDLATIEAEDGNWEAAVGAARLLCAIEPLREDGHRLLMKAYAATGNRALALQQYRRCIEVLGRELAVDPMPETTALARALADARPPAPPPIRQVGSALTALVATRATLVEAIGSIDAAIRASKPEPVP
ncbi:AfsR/SARP family transcriptional regulator [Sphingomonas qomolangmaensis]|uniref:Bacterial transcriptional activator domain-containing protein n=1 Tax=Sphingomonas qomolangmaensis TaxID=2918765 RepID=A0ABY5LAU4_9SPHN|nr:bacterial transcriptional activator domain-containing protein [Sphingomonas qomolangmaensis]UUL84070.1 bacterial transcriptional activator domain-containing protein [Sphingomonas qomolangmaensis]